MDRTEIDAAIAETEIIEGNWVDNAKVDKLLSLRGHLVDALAVIDAKEPAGPVVNSLAVISVIDNTGFTDIVKTISPGLGSWYSCRWTASTGHPIEIVVHESDYNFMIEDVNQLAAKAIDNVDLKVVPSFPTREETVKKVHSDMEDADDAYFNLKKAVHYGYVELRSLMDFLYGGEPKTEAEKLKRIRDES